MPLKNLEDLQKIEVGDIIGMGQLTDTIPTLCVSKNKKIHLLGNMDNKMIIKYSILIEEVEGFYEDGSILYSRRDGRNVEYIENFSEEYESLKKQLITAGIWEVGE